MSDKELKGDPYKGIVLINWLVFKPDHSSM
jgi:hypothetical protein